MSLFWALPTHISLSQFSSADEAAIFFRDQLCEDSSLTVRHSVLGPYDNVSDGLDLAVTLDPVETLSFEHIRALGGLAERLQAAEAKISGLEDEKSALLEENELLVKANGILRKQAAEDRDTLERERGEMQDSTKKVAEKFKGLAEKIIHMDDPAEVDFSSKRTASTTTPSDSCKEGVEVADTPVSPRLLKRGKRILNVMRAASKSKESNGVGGHGVDGG